jgi:hypothetical protein
VLGLTSDQPDLDIPPSIADDSAATVLAAEPQANLLQRPSVRARLSKLNQRDNTLGHEFLGQSFKVFQILPIHEEWTSQL